MATLRSTCSVRYLGSIRGKSKGFEEFSLRVPPVRIITREEVYLKMKELTRCGGNDVGY